jgi:hypothetical protein
MSLPENHCSILFATGYKRLTEGGLEAFCLGVFCFGAFGLRLLLLTFGFMTWEAFGREKNC